MSFFIRCFVERRLNCKIKIYKNVQMHVQNFVFNFYPIFVEVLCFSYELLLDIFQENNVRNEVNNYMLSLA